MTAPPLADRDSSPGHDEPVTALEDARVVALEASQADYGAAVLAAVNALDANTIRLDRLENKVDDTNARVRSLEEGQVEIKDLLVRVLDK